MHSSYLSNLHQKLKHMPYLLMLMLLCFIQLSLANTERRIALVIGNSSYNPNMGSLPNPVNDAQDMSQVLRELGFEVISGINLNKKEMSEKVRLFDQRLQEGDKDSTIGLFYYAGHGLEVEGSNYLVPVDAVMDYQEDARDEGVPLNRITSRMNYANNRMNIVILDACRNNPLPKRNRSAAGGWGAFNDVASGMFIAYGTSPGRKAADGTGRNGLFTKHILKNIKAEGKTLEQVFKYTRSGVLDESGGQQLTWSNNATTGDFYFASGVNQDSNKLTLMQIAQGINDSMKIPDLNEKGRTAYDAKNFVEAFTHYSQSAALGDPHAQTFLGFLYSQGSGVTQNHSKALEWYTKAAKQNDSYAQHKLGLIYDEGKGVVEDKAQAFEWYSKAAANSYTAAYEKLAKAYYTGSGVAQNLPLAFQWYSKAADNSYSTAYEKLAEAYYHGLGVEQNHPLALQWFKKSADETHSAISQTYLGVMYQYGYGTENNYPLALQYYQQAEAQNYMMAVYNIGTLYDAGIGMPLDQAKAVEYYKRAARTGEENAIKALNARGIYTYE